MALTATDISRFSGCGMTSASVAASVDEEYRPKRVVLRFFLFCRHGCSADDPCLQRQKPAMFAQMPLFVYRHFTGAVCTTSSDGRFALFSAPSTAAFSVASRLSNSSDILLRASSKPPHRGSPVARTTFKVLI
jgi:hypothetical protein